MNQVEDNYLNNLMSRSKKPQSLKEEFLVATFQIIAEGGGDALSASELIRETGSSKGALFHHFKTLEDLFLESLRYFKETLQFSFIEKTVTNLNDYVDALAQDIMSRQAHKGYFYIVHFYRDRALKDARFAEALWALYDSYIDTMVEELKPLVPPTTDFTQVRHVLISFYFGMEGPSYRKVILNSSEEFDGFFDWFKQGLLSKLKSVCKV